MPFNPEFTVSKEDKQKIIQTLTVMRKMRGAADEESVYNREGRVQAILSDAETLGQLASQAMIDLLSPHPKTASDQWEKYLNNFKKEYGGYNICQSVQKTYENPAEHLSLLLTLMNYGDTPTLRKILKNRLLEENWLGISSLDYLFSDQIGVLAPLSTDYLYAMVSREFISRHLSPQCFRLRAVILGRALNLVAMPLDEDKTPAFKDVKELMVMTDLNVSHRTRSAVLNGAKAYYPTHFIHGIS